MNSFAVVVNLPLVRTVVVFGRGVRFFPLCYSLLLGDQEKELSGLFIPY